MTTDAFSNNFSFADDEKNASPSLNAVPDSKIDSLDIDQPVSGLTGGDGTPNSGDTPSQGASDEPEFDSMPNFDLPDSTGGAGQKDVADPFAGFSFGFDQPDEFADLPAEIGNDDDAGAESGLTFGQHETENGDEAAGFSLGEATDDPFSLVNAGNSVDEFETADEAETEVEAETPLAIETTESESLEIGDFSLDAPEFLQGADETGLADAEPGEVEAIEEPSEVESIAFDATGPAGEDEATSIEPDSEAAPASFETGAGSATFEEEIEPIVLVTPVKVVAQGQYDEAFAPFLKDPPHVATVAILGASGIGSSHARWFVKHGCQVVSFLGSSAESIEATKEKLTREVGFEGQGYTNLRQLLDESKPEIVCVATPSAFHFVHALEALEAGAHVLCEKPLTYAPARKLRENLAGANELIKTARKKNLLLGTQLQYGAATPIMTKLAGVTPEEVGDFAMEIETTNPSAPREPRELWIDLGPHALSIASALGGEGAKLLEDSIQFFPRVEGQMVEASARFSIRRADERLITVRSITRYAPKDSMWRAPYRRFSFNGRVVLYRGYQTPSGEYAAQFTAPDGYDSHYPDPVDFLIGNFVRAVHGEEELLIDGEFGKQNLEWLLKINAE